MKKLYLALAIVLAMTLVAGVTVVRAYDWSGTSINSGYAITTDWHGMEVPLGAPVTARAGTTNLNIIRVVFRWLKPDGTEAWPPHEVTPHSETDTWNSQPMLVFISIRNPDEVGDWAVQAIFYDSEGHGEGPLHEEATVKVSIRASSFFAIPEGPIGTISILLAMFVALGVIVVKRKSAIPKLF